MKTLKEIANELGVSKQAVYKRYRGKLYKSVFPYMRVVDGTIYIWEQGESIIKRDFLNDNVSLGDAFDKLERLLERELKTINGQLTELINLVKNHAISASKPQKYKHQKKKTQLNKAKTSAPLERLINQK